MPCSTVKMCSNHHVFKVFVNIEKFERILLKYNPLAIVSPNGLRNYKDSGRQPKEGLQASEETGGFPNRNKN